MKNKTNKKALTELENLFEFCPPQELRKTLNRLFIVYVMNNHNVLPVDFDEMSENVFLLNDFLESVEALNIEKG